MSSKISSVSRERAPSAAGLARRARALRVLPLALVMIGAVGMPTLLVKSGGLARLGELSRERETVEVEISRLARRVAELEARSRAARDDPRAVERAARDQLGLVRTNEVVFQFTPRPAVGKARSER